MTAPKPLTQSVILAIVAGLLYASLFFLNNWVFSSLEFSAAVNWLYLPAGLRLLLVLLFGLSGALGISLASATVSVLMYFPHDPLTGLAAGFISGFAPYLVQILLQRFAGLQNSLADITGPGLLRLTLLYAAATSFGHQIWFAYLGVTEDFWLSVWPMFVGDLLGTVAVLYAAHAVVRLARRRIAG